MIYWWKKRLTVENQVLLSQKETYAQICADKKVGLKPQVVSQVFDKGENAEASTLTKIAHGVNKRIVLKLV